MDPRQLTAPGHPARRIALALLIAVAAVYGFTAGFGFVFDDHVQIERNPWLRSPDGLRLLLTRPFWGFDRERGPAPSNYYRPAFGASYAVQARLFGLDPGAFHAVSLLLHLAVCLLVAEGARRLYRSQASGLVAGLLFAVHPAHAEAVAWVGGQADLLAAVFALAAVGLYLADRPVPGASAYLLAGLSKETGVAALLVLLAVEATEWRERGGRRRAAARLAPYGLALGLYLILRIHALGSFAPRDYGVTGSAAGAVAYGGALLARYLGFLAVPFPAQVLAVVPVPRLLSPVALAGLAAAGAALVGLAAAAWRGRGPRGIVLPVAWTLAFLLPVLRADAIGGSNFAERYLYLPSVGACWLAGLLGARLWERAGSPAARRALAGGFLLLIAGLGVAAGLRSALFRNDRELFAAAVRTVPQSEIAHNNLGMALFAENRVAEAEREYRQALHLQPWAVAPLANLALVQERRGDLAAARRSFEEVLRRRPTHAVAAVHLARQDLRRGDRASAARRLDALFRAGGESYDALVERAKLWIGDGRPDLARPLLERAVRTFPERREARELLRRGTPGTVRPEGPAA